MRRLKQGAGSFEGTQKYRQLSEAVVGVVWHNSSGSGEYSSKGARPNVTNSSQEGRATNLGTHAAGDVRGCRRGRKRPPRCGARLPNAAGGEHCSAQTRTGVLHAAVRPFEAIRVPSYASRGISLSLCEAVAFNRCTKWERTCRRSRKHRLRSCDAQRYRMLSDLVLGRDKFY